MKRVFNSRRTRGRRWEIAILRGSVKRTVEALENVRVISFFFFYRERNINDRDAAITVPYRVL